MSRSGDFNRLINTTFTIQRGPGGTANLVIDNLLSEVYQTMDREEREYENGPAFAVLKFYCHDASDPAQEGFLRLYYQIPFNDTLYASPEVREKDAESSPGHAEYLALTALHKAHCTAVPPLMGFGEKKQSDNDYVPRGYILYLAWVRVPGSPLNYELFWKETREYRDKVRAAFALAYKELNRHEWQPFKHFLENLIYDPRTDTLHIAGFRPSGKIGGRPLSNVEVALWGLIKFPKKVDWKEDPDSWEW